MTPAFRVSSLAAAFAVAALAIGTEASGETRAGERAPVAGTHGSRPAPKKRAPRRKHVIHSGATRRGTSRLSFATTGRTTGDALVDDADLPPVRNGRCPPEMVSIDGRYCVDRYEGSLVEMTDAGERLWSPFDVPDGHVVRAVSVPGVFPQGYISGEKAQDACARSFKRLCRAAEWRKACAGPDARLYGYSDTRERRRCNDSGRSPMLAIWHLDGDSDPSLWDPTRMNDTRLNQLAGSLAKTGEHPACTNAYGVLDMVGNLHEWIDDPDGTFQGGYYLDTTINGEGCAYRTTAHELAYHDYSTGFRCCSDPVP